MTKISIYNQSAFTSTKLGQMYLNGKEWDGNAIEVIK